MFAPIFSQTHYNLKHSVLTVDELVKNSKSYTACGMVDSDTLSGAIEFYKACKEHKDEQGNKAPVKPIIGTTLKGLTLIAKNQAGWKNLIKLVSNEEETLDVDNVIVSSGHLDSLLYNRADSDTLKALKKKFPNFYVEAEEPYNPKIKQLREIAEQEGVPTIAYWSTRYIKDKRDLLHILLAGDLKTTVAQLKNQIITDNRVRSLVHDNYGLPNKEELAGFSNDELKNIQRIIDDCDDYNLSSKPSLPEFKWTGGQTEVQYLQYLCDEGLKRRGVDTPEYQARVAYEMSVITGADLQGYFLIKQDIIKWAKSQGWLVGPSRGSVGGSLIAYATGITELDPIKYNLMFERFYNKGRNTGDHIEYPDIDTDFPKQHRDKVVDYLRNKYGEQHVAQISTFGRLMGRGSLTEVLRTQEVCSNETIKRITKPIPNKDKISDLLEEKKEKSILNYLLNYDPDTLQEYCRLDDDGNFHGEYAHYFQQAIALEGIYNSRGKHAGGVVIGREPLINYCPLVEDKGSDHKLCGLEMNSLAYVGLIKLDLLATAVLDKLMRVQDLLIGKM